LTSALGDADDSSRPRQGQKRVSLEVCPTQCDRGSTDIALNRLAAAADAYTAHPALLRLQELEALKELSRSANARIYIGFDEHMLAGKD
jgi:hypothetical protein